MVPEPPPPVPESDSPVGDAGEPGDGMLSVDSGRSGSWRRGMEATVGMCGGESTSVAAAAAAAAAADTSDEMARADDIGLDAVGLGGANEVRAELWEGGAGGRCE